MNAPDSTAAAAPPARRGPLAALLVLIALLAAALRFIGLSWGLPYPLHPDEGVILARVAAMSWGNLDPGFFIYPGLFIYQVFALDRIVTALGGESWRIIYWARVLTALYSLATVALVYLLGARLGGRRVGVLAAALTAVTGALTLHAHYAVTDTPMTALATAVVWLAVRAWQRGSRGGMFAAAALAGLAVSTKYSAVMVCFVPWLGLMALAARARAPLARRLTTTVLLAATSVAAFLVTSPYTVLDYRGFLDDMAVESHLQARARAGYHIDPLEAPRLADRGLVANTSAAFADLGPAAFGLALGVALLLLGGLPGATRALRHGGSGTEEGARAGPIARDPVAGLLVVAWIGGYFLLMAPSAIGGQRYILPVYPAMMVLVALGIEQFVALWQRAGRLRTTGAATATAVAVLIVAAVPPLIEAVTDADLLAQRDTRLVARDWILANIPQRSHLAREFYAPPIHTDDNYRLSQPFSLTEHPLATYCKEQVDYLLLSSLNAARYLESDESRFAEERAWYARLDERTRVVQRIDGRGHLELHHPTIEIRRLFCPTTNQSMR